MNKQIHAEAVGYLYKQPIVLDDTMALHNFVAAIGSNKTLVTDLTIKGWGRGRGTHKAMNFCAFTLLAGCTNLQRLNLDCGIGYAPTAKGIARQIYRDGCYFLEAFGAAREKKDAALDVLELVDCNIGRVHTRPLAGPFINMAEQQDFRADFNTEMRRLLGCK